MGPHRELHQSFLFLNEPIQRYLLQLYMLVIRQSVTNTIIFHSNLRRPPPRLTLPITTTDVNANNYYYLFIEKMRNPDQTACEAGKMRISVSSDNGSTIKSRSAASMWNIVSLSFTKNPNQINLKWVDSTTSQEITTITAYIGVFSGSVSLASDYGAFVKAFTVYTPDSTFYINPVKPRATLGYSGSTFSIAGSKTITQGLFLTQLQKTDDADAQTELPFLKINVR